MHGSSGCLLFICQNVYLKLTHGKGKVKLHFTSGIQKSAAFATSTRYPEPACFVPRVVSDDPVQMQ